MENSQSVKIGIFRFIRFMLEVWKTTSKNETMDRGMICPSLVFDHLLVQPQTVPFEYQHKDGVVVFFSFVSKVFPDT